MKRIHYLLIVAAFLVFVPMSDACVGRILYIGIPSSPNEQLLAEMVSILINERTGSNVKILFYKDSKELYNAVKQGQIGMLIENTDRAMEVLGKPKETNMKTAYELIKSEYRKNLNLVWLEPFGGAQHYAPVLTVETLTNYPALPKLISKLTAALNNETYAKLFKSVKSDEKPKKVAKDYLKAKKLI
ncbi:MAG: hypothetical protein FD174_3343 [Geobacteraceae bacterium]|nr:MAG: hypothetical protein FD174_3343 [Geobacteraceae bacterium]